MTTDPAAQASDTSPALGIAHIPDTSPSTVRHARPLRQLQPHDRHRPRAAPRRAGRGRARAGRPVRLAAPTDADGRFRSRSIRRCLAPPVVLADAAEASIHGRAVTGEERGRLERMRSGVNVAYRLADLPRRRVRRQRRRDRPRAAGRRRPGAARDARQLPPRRADHRRCGQARRRGDGRHAAPSTATTTFSQPSDASGRYSSFFPPPTSSVEPGADDRAGREGQVSHASRGGRERRVRPPAQRRDGRSPDRPADAMPLPRARARPGPTTAGSCRRLGPARDRDAGLGHLAGPPRPLRAGLPDERPRRPAPLLAGRSPGLRRAAARPGARSTSSSGPRSLPPSAPRDVATLQIPRPERGQTRL